MALIEAGDFRFEVDEGWGRLPDGMRAGVVTGVVADSQGRVYLCQQQQDPPVLVFDRNGNFLDSWGTGYVVEPHTMYIGPDDVIYLADRGAHVAMKLSVSGEVLLEVGNRGQPSDTGCFEDEGVVLRAGGPFNRPTRLSPSPSGDLYASDGYRNCRVHRFAADGQFIASWGRPGGDGPGAFFSPHCLWVDHEGLIYVCDRKNNRIQIFDPEGEFVAQWTNVQLPTDLHIGQDGLFYLAERESGEATENLLTVRDSQGSVLANWTTPRSHQIWPDAHGDIYLVSGGATDAAKGLGTKYVKVR
jgi:DNA-binding beta-propeller fold protein YncE